MTEMHLNTTVNDTTFQRDVWPLVVFNENDNLTTERNAVLYYYEEINAGFQFQFLLDDTTMAIAVMTISLSKTLLNALYPLKNILIKYTQS